MQSPQAIGHFSMTNSYWQYRANWDSGISAHVTPGVISSSLSTHSDVFTVGSIVGVGVGEGVENV